jgi:carbon monoxide dehydrogenase subunit G
MPTVSGEIDVEAEPAQVWEVLIHADNIGSWMSNHVRFVGPPPATLEADTEFAQQLTVMGMPTQVNWIVVDSEPERLVSLSGKGPMGVRLMTSYELAESGGGTTLSCSMDVSGGMVAAVSGRLTDELTTATNSSLNRLKSLVESGSGG